MNYAIEKLEEIEKNIKLDLKTFDINENMIGKSKDELKLKLRDTQTAILVLQSGKEILTLGKIIALEQFNRK